MAGKSVEVVVGSDCTARNPLRNISKAWGSQQFGEVSERFKEAVLKTAVVHATVGSNPTLSAYLEVMPNGPQLQRFTGPEGELST